MVLRAQESLNVNHIGGGNMDEEKRARIEMFREDLKNLDEEIKATENAKEIHTAHRTYFGNKVGKLEFERWVVETNIKRLENGLPEIPWPYEQVDPSDVVDYSREN